jgi:hypothetical protein
LVLHRLEEPQEKIVGQTVICPQLWAALLPLLLHPLVLFLMAVAEVVVVMGLAVKQETTVVQAAEVLKA